jgi:hypothetical protein
MARVTSKKRFDKADHEEWAKPIVANDTGYSLLAKLLVDAYGVDDRLLVLALQAREANSRLRAELNRRYILQGFHEGDHRSPYYPEQTYGNAGEVEAGDAGLPGPRDEHGPERPDAGQCPGTGEPDQRPGGDAPAAAGVSGGAVRGREYLIRESPLVLAGRVGWMKGDCLESMPMAMVDFRRLPVELVVAPGWKEATAKEIQERG